MSFKKRIIYPITALYGSIWYRFFLFAHQHRLNPPSSTLSPSELLDSEKVFERELTWHAARLGCLRRILRRIPFWLEGHLILAELTLEGGDVATAYASALAAIELKGAPRQEAKAKLLLGQVYLKGAMIDKALELLEGLNKEGGGDSQVKENLAAALMAKGDIPRAERLLAELPPEKMSAQAKAALLFAAGKRKEEK